MESASKCHAYLKKKILNRNFEGFEVERSSLLRTIKTAIEFGEANSALVLGPSGSGKTMVSTSILRHMLLRFI